MGRWQNLGVGNEVSDISSSPKHNSSPQDNPSFECTLDKRGLWLDPPDEDVGVAETREPAETPTGSIVGDAFWDGEGETRNWRMSSCMRVINNTV